MARQITVVLRAGAKREVTSPVLSDEDAESHFAQIRAAQQEASNELIDLPWLSVKKGMIQVAHVVDAAQSQGAAVASWE